MGDILHETALGLKGDWDLQLPDTLSEEAVVQLLAQRIAEIIGQGSEKFFQLMYRIDIPEKKINAILGEGDIAYKVARLVYERQLQKIQSRIDNRMHSDNSDPELKW